jgi:hypothetical protein
VVYGGYFFYLSYPGTSLSQSLELEGRSGARVMIQTEYVGMIIGRICPQKPVFFEYVHSRTVAY